MKPSMAVVAVASVLLIVSVARAQQERPAPQPSAHPPTPPPLSSIAGRVLTLDEAVAIALETQPQIQARLYDYAAARYRVDEALAPLLPQLTGSASAIKSLNSLIPSSAVSSLPITFKRNWDQTFVAQVALSQLLFDFGKNMAGRDAAKKLEAVALEDVELQRQLIALAVKEAYTNILFAQRLTRVNQQALDRAELNLKSARGFFEVGTRPKSDVTRAEVDVANGKLAVIQARNAERLARVALNTAMGINVDTPTQVQDNLVYEPFELDHLGMRAEALRQRPEMRQSRLRAEAALAQQRQAFRNFFPDITGSGTYGGARPELSEFWALTLSMSWTLYDGGNRIARYREAEATRNSAQFQVKAEEQTVIQDVEQAFLTVTEASERIQAAQAAVASAQENFRLAQGRFDAGVGTILELTDAQLALTQAQNTEAQALSDYRIAIYRLDRARGRR